MSYDKKPIFLSSRSAEAAVVKTSGVAKQQGAKNIFVKSEEYNTEKGISGKKAYGTFTTKDSKERARYQVLLFAQKGGFQNIIIVHKDNDEVANEITERILNSVELKLAQ